MNNINDFLGKLNEETFSVMKEEEDKEFGREEALSLIGGFVKDVKKKFPSKSDTVDILKAALQTLEFFINEIEKGDDSYNFKNVNLDVGSGRESFDPFDDHK